MLKIKFIFPITGGVTIQLQKGTNIYQHTYPQKHIVLAAQVIQIAIESREGLDLSTFPDNECNDWLIPTFQELASGYYVVYDSFNDLQLRADMGRRSIFLMKNVLMVYNIEMKHKSLRGSSNSLVIKSV